MKVILSLFAFASFAVAAASDQPNILIIFTDDQGYADLACYGLIEFIRPFCDGAHLAARY